MKINDPFTKDPNVLYELMAEQAKKRFGSECKHINIKNGRCVDCLRKVIYKLPKDK